MAKHTWVEVSYTTIEVEVQSDGETMDIFATTDAIEIAQEDVAHGCWHCGQSLKPENIAEECPNSPVLV